MERLRHPNLANLIEHGRVTIDAQSVRYVAWEFIDGEALDHKLRAGPLPAKTVACMGRDVARAIEHIWTARIVHRDVNPKNIMLRVGDREAVLIDLGVARHLGEKTITTTGVTWGTVGYLSPEQCQADRQLTCQSDVYCLGIVLQQALCGRHPTNGDQVALITKPVRTVDLVPNTPAALADLIDRMFLARAAFRPTPAAIAEKLAEIAEWL
jgi:serine/threonine protein kinase